MPKTARDGFTPELFAFLSDLARNNRRDWFQAERSRYERSVQEPAVRFIATVAPGLAKVSPRLIADPRPFRGSLTRIYRDTRFSRDKSPYHTHVGLHFGYRDAGRSKFEGPGFYLRLAPGGSALHAGLWQPAPPAVREIRDAIVARPADWRKARSAGEALEGDPLRRVPAGFPKDHPFADDLRRRSFVASVPFRDAEVVARGFPERFGTTCRTLVPLNRFLAGALGLPW